MKRYMQHAFIGWIALIAISFTACDEWLDLKPESEIILDEFWQTEADVESVLAACYRGMIEDAVIYRMMVWGELRSDNVVNGRSFPNARYDMQKIIEGDITATNSYSSWGAFYSVINYCNNLLYYAPLVTERDINFSQADLQRVQAEALSLRALAYFYLVRAFKEVPLILDPSIDDTQDYNLPKSSEDVIIQKIIEDLLIARQFARIDFGNRAYNKGRITRAAVNAILTDVYLWAERYQDAVNAADEVLANTSFRLVDPSLMLTQVFYLGNSTESVFELQFDENVQRNNPVFNLYGNNGNELGEFAFPATLAHDMANDLVGAYSPFVFKVSTTVTESDDDIRAKDFYRQYGGKFYVFKYSGLARQEGLDGFSLYRYRSTTPNWIIYRITDIMLMKAEALVQLGVKDNNNPELLNQAVNLVNVPYLRSNVGADSLRLVNYTSAQDVEKLVLRERQRELMFEGKRWFDLVRQARREGSTTTLNQLVGYKNPGSTLMLGAMVLDAMYMPISRRELEANPNLVQNPYYKENTSTSTR